VLVVVIVCLLAERAYSAHVTTTERRRLTNAALARSASEQALMDRAVDAPAPKPPPDPYAELEGFDGMVGLS
jgi:hypothetical protein